MRVTTTDYFNKWVLARNNVYPYSKLRLTRNGITCKWILLQSKQGKVTKRFAVLAKTLPNQMIEELILTGKAKPFTPELSEIMDCMHEWGKLRNVHWYNDSIVVLDYYLQHEVGRKELVKRLISMEVEVEIHTYFGVDSLAGSLVMLEWSKWYDRTYGVGPSSFKGMAMYSLDYTAWVIHQILN